MSPHVRRKDVNESAMASLLSNVYGAFTLSILQAAPTAEFDPSVHRPDRSTTIGRLMKRGVKARPSGPRRINESLSHAEACVPFSPLIAYLGEFRTWNRLTLPCICRPPSLLMAALCLPLLHFLSHLLPLPL
jgi:hypothetical protein